MEVSLLSFSQTLATLITPSMSRSVVNLSASIANSYWILIQDVSGSNLSIFPIAMHLLRKSDNAAIC